jgi:hypothetical protein
MESSRFNQGGFMKSVPLQHVEFGGGVLLGPHFGAIAYNFKAELAKPRHAIPCMDDESFWRRVLKSELKAGMSLTLDGFRVYGWFPRAPGLYYTRQAESSRQEAMQYVRRDLPRPASAVSDLSGQDYTVVLTPEGKSSMLQGGIGCIKLKPVVLPPALLIAAFRSQCRSGCTSGCWRSG